MSLVQSVLSGNRLALARLLSHIENDNPEGRNALSALFSHTGNAHLIGVTGAPGTGKSSLVNQLARYYRTLPEKKERKRVAIIAVDPSSPFSGGALLGDRIRMRDLSGDQDVFIRSMAARGSLGGLAKTTAGLAQAFDAAGFEIIIIETVGAGQAEVDIAMLAHTTLVIEAPGLGDDIQAIKAGILEIADILVVNKADRPGAENTERTLKNMLKLAQNGPRVFKQPAGFIDEHADSTDEKERAGWIPPVLRTVSINEGEGIQQLAEAISNHYKHLQKTGDLKRRERYRLQHELDILIQDMLVNQWWSNVSKDQYNMVLEKLVARSISPRQAVQKLTEVEQ